MRKTDKEIAFLRDLIIAPDWTLRFTEIFDKTFKFADEKEILYINGGTGAHPLELQDKLGLDVRVSAFSYDTEANEIARGKTQMAQMEMPFLDEFPRESFDLVIADASLVRPDELNDFIEEAADLADERIAIMLPTSGSFGEIFSYLWESFLNAGLLDRAAEVEKILTEIPIVAAVEETLKSFDIKGIKSVTESEIFDYENGKEFIEAPLVADFLMPEWLAFLNEDEQGLVKETLAQLIDESAEGLSFRFTVKATLVTGTK